MFTSHEIVEQLLEDTLYEWEYAKCGPHANCDDTGHHRGVSNAGTVWYSRHCGGGAFIGSFRYSITDEFVLVLHDFARNLRNGITYREMDEGYQGSSEFSVYLAQPDSFQLASDFIRKVWNNQQPDRKPIDGPRKHW